MKRNPQTQSLLPTEIIKVGDNKININFETQTSKLGRPFRFSGIRLCTDAQKLFETRILNLGYEYHLIRDLETFKSLIYEKNV